MGHIFKQICHQICTSWVNLDRLLVPLGRSWASLGLSWGTFGPLWAAFDCSGMPLWGRLFSPSVSPEPPKSHFTRLLTDSKLRDINIEDTFFQHLLECMVMVARKARILGSSMMWAIMNNKQQIHYTYAVPRCRFVASVARQLPPLSWQDSSRPCYPSGTLSFVYFVHYIETFLVTFQETP